MRGAQPDGIERDGGDDVLRVHLGQSDVAGTTQATTSDAQRVCVLDSPPQPHIAPETRPWIGALVPLAAPGVSHAAGGLACAVRPWTG
jgi:hypothetical protein